ncbi:alpha/beta hydrolase fold domain-containing protein [Rhizobium leguminosarum bv. viciae]|uniref:alpha/beta hydrolase n=1 Tax=Rhizobium leguminosarum TaxID=384 RepID=UPI001441AA73|nr:alpha/beta hydrolase [Rhizobium leguminosarum]NKJ94731.1 alpha/beta hydrolase fold domain-containing protein [Rhizobium leguminosarum bv. viciae]NKK87455.1 alpha/beta hydrolase fold domain-containing protein [Rhizobium leguminosarum bv. viciae]
MAFALNSEIAAGLEKLANEIGPISPMPVGDVATRRSVYDELQRVIHSKLDHPHDVTVEDYETASEDGAPLLLRWYSKKGSNPGSAVVYCHGGGMMLSSVDVYDTVLARYVSFSGVPFLAVGYRKAPEAPAPIPVTDCHAGLRWLAEHAATLGVEPTRIAVMGDSGGGGIAASLAIYARDQHGPQIAKQILIYPMLDDRNTIPDANLTPFAPWSYDDNITGWTALLGPARGGPEVSPYGAAARLTNFSNLPNAYIDIGEMDIFRDETILYARNLLLAGVSTELHVHPGVAHAFEAFVPDAEIAQKVALDRIRVLQTL